MSAAILPDLPRSVEYIIREINRDRALEPTFGGDESLIQRIGTKHEIVVTVPAIASAFCGPALIAALSVGKSAGVLLPIPEPKLPDVPYGSPLVVGAEQIGSSMNVDGLTPQVAIRAGKWLSVTVSGRRFAYFTTADVIADSSGAATLPLYPMIRRSPADNATIEIAKPLLEGRVIMSEREVRRIGSLSFSFTVRERG